MRIWDTDDHYVYSGQDGALFVYTIEEGWEALYKAGRAYDHICVHAAMSDDVPDEAFAGLLDDTLESLDNDNYELILTGVGRISFGVKGDGEYSFFNTKDDEDNGYLVPFEDSPLTIVVPSEDEGKVIVFSNAGSKEEVDSLLAFMLESFSIPA